MSDDVRFVVRGEPIPKGRPRVTKTGHAYTPQRTVVYEKLVRHSYIAQCGAFRFPDGSPIEITINGYFPVPKSVSKRRAAKMQAGEYKTTRPDLDNIIKSITDGLNGLAFKDDSQICVINATKRYSRYPYTTVRLHMLQED